jgi:hypothetical protein
MTTILFQLLLQHSSRLFICQTQRNTRMLAPKNGGAGATINAKVSVETSDLLATMRIGMIIETPKDIVKSIVRAWIQSSHRYVKSLYLASVQESCSSLLLSPCQDNCHSTMRQHGQCALTLHHDNNPACPYYVEVCLC